MSATAVLALYGLWRFWPSPPPATGLAPRTAKFSYFGWRLTLTRDQQFFVMAALAGVIGAMFHALRSLSTYIGTRYLFRSWLAYYAVLPLLGALLATIVYVVLRAGLLPGGTASSQPDPYGIAAISALVGLFSAETAKKLQAVFVAIFGETQPESEHFTAGSTETEPGRRPATEIAAPAITGFKPRKGQAGTSVVISGDNLTMVKGVAFTGADAPQFKVDSAKSLTVTVPSGAVTGPITLRTDQDRVSSGEDFTVTG